MDDPLLLALEFAAFAHVGMGFVLLTSARRALRRGKESARSAHRYAMGSFVALALGVLVAAVTVRAAFGAGVWSSTFSLAVNLGAVGIVVLVLVSLGLQVASFVALRRA